MLSRLTVVERERLLQRARSLNLKQRIVGVPSIAHIGRGERIPLSYAQQRLWFLAQMEGVSEAYHIPYGLRLKGQLDHAAFHQALDRIVARHEVLRTTFPAADGEAVQRIASVEGSGFQLFKHDLRKGGDVQGELERLVAEEASLSFDLEVGPLIRGRLIRLAEDEHVLLITMHHIVSDGWSMGVMCKELSALYEVFLKGEPDPLRELEVQYADYAVWQREWIDGEILKRQADYWKTTLAGATALLELPADHVRPVEKDYAGAFVKLVLDKELTAGLKELSKRHKTTMYMTLLAGWGALLARLSGQQDVVVGTPVANRGRVELEGLIGFFVNTLALRLDISGSPTVGGLLERVKAQVLAAQEHQDIPFEQVVEIIRPARSLSYSPVFQVMFAWQNVPRDTLKLSGLEVESLRLAPHMVAKFDLTLSLQEAEEKVVGGVEYATSLFERSTVERYLGYFRKLLEGMVADETQEVDRLPVLPESERRQLLYEWNDTRTEYPREKCVHELFEEQVERNPEAVAVVYEDQQLTYGELNRRANQLAHYLRELGVKPDGRVAICVERGFEMMVALLGVLKAGGAYVPLDPAYPVERLRFMLEDSAPVVLLTQRHLKELFTGLKAIVPVLDLADEAAPWRERSETDLDRVSVGLTPEHLAYVIYTSGSTGTPKGVMVEHGNVARLFTATDVWFQFSRNDVWALFHSYAFDFSVWEIFGALLYGGRLVVVPQDSVRSPEDFYRLLCWAGVTVLNQTPTAFRQLIAAQAKDKKLHQLRFVIFGGEALEVAMLRYWYEQNEGIGTQLVNMYGITETTVHVTYQTLEPTDCERRGRSPIGCRIPDLKIYILDSQGAPAPVGVVGELYIGGAGVARGYLNRAELTAERFIADPFAEEAGARMYRTGDLGRWLKDGTIEFVGRNDDQVKIRGFRIELGEIEVRLAEHVGVEEAVVVAREEEAGDKRLVAYYTVAKGAGQQGDVVGAEQLRAHLTARLPEYMVPAAYVRMERLPLTANGKLDRKGLPAPEGDAYVVRGYEAPQGETEITLARIWGEVLKIERVGRHDNFFELGGHSLLAVTLVERMRRSDLQVDVRALFTTPTVAELARAVGADAGMVEVPANRIPEGCEAITPEMLPLVDLSGEEIETIVSGVPGGARNVQDIYALAPLQEGILFHHLMGGEGDPYLLATLVEFDSRGRLDSYLEAMQWVIERHDILRTGVVWEGLRQPVQVVWRKAILAVEEVELAGGDVEEQLYERFDPRRHRIDVGQAPLLRAYITYDGQKERWLLMMLLHHLIDDNTSLRRMHGEIQAHLLGRTEQLPAPQPFRNLVAQARLGVSRQEHEAFFRKVLGDVEEPTAPLGLLEVRGDGTGIEQARIRLDSVLAGRLRARARKLGVSAASLCHVAWAQVLARLSGREDVVFGTVLFGRMQGVAGADRGMGLFINTLPVRIRMGEEGVEASVQRTHKLLAELLYHEHASLALAQRCSGVAAPMPLFSSLLNYRHSGGAARARSEEEARAWEGMKWLRGEERTNYPLTLSVDDLGEGFGLTAQTVASIEPKRVCEYMRRALESLITALETAPATRVGSLEVLPESERRQLLYEWNDTRTEYPREKCVHELFEEQVERNPEAVAVVYEDQQLTYGELNRRANQLAHYLRELGVKPDGRVAICVERGFEMMVALLGVLKAGGAYVPLDPAYPVERLRFMLEDSAPVVLLTQRHLKELFTGLKAIVPVLDLADEAAPWRERSETDLDRVSVGLTPEHLAYVIYTSGSTGTPKGVMVEHKSLVNRLVWMQSEYQLDLDDAVLQKTPFSFDVSVWELFWPSFVGARLVMARSGGHKDPIYLGDIIQHNRITTIHFVPSMLQTLLEQRGSVRSSLERVVCSGETLPIVLARRSQERLPNVQLHNLYGPTEATVDVTAWTYSADTAMITVPIGRPIANTQIYILDSQGAPAPVGVVGELYIGGAGVARGYLNRAELTAERFIADPFAEEAGARMYRTGDLGRWLKDGTIEFVGRNDDQVKIRGFRIELGEIEVRLAEHVGVEEAVVVAREEEAGDKRLVAYYTVAKGAGQQGDVVGAEQLRAHLTARLPEYMVPAAYVRMERLPLTANGKLDRKGLPAPEGDAYVVRGYEAPQGETEITLARIWGEVLKIERVGRHDNFFELGGHSLLAVTLVERMRRSDLQVDVRALFTTPTVAELARAVGADAGMVEVPANRIPEGCEAITPEMLPLVDLSGEEIETIVSGVPGGARNVQDIYALAPLQEGILFHHLMGGEGDPYLLATLVEFDSRGRLDSYLEAMQWVIERHDILRTGVVWEGLRQPVQVVWRKAILAVEEVELAGGDVEEQLYERFDPRRHRIDVGQAPLLRAYITYDGQKERWLLMMLLHHLAGDHSTLEVMHGEIQAHLLGRTEQLPAPQPFRNLVAQARLGVSRQEHEAFFRKVLGDVEEPTAPLGLLEVRGDGTGIEQARIRLDSVLAGRLRARARKLGVSAASLCHVAWAQVLARLSGREDVVFGTVLFGRMQGVAGADRGMGLFINTLPVRIRMGEEGVEASVQRTHKLLAELLYHEHASLALAQRCSGVAAPMPLFSSLLNYRHSGGAARARSEEEARAWEGMKWLRGEERTNYPLTLSVDDLGEGFGLTAQTVASIEPKRVCEYMRRALESLITALETAPATRVGSLEVLPESERRQLLYEWNDTRTEYPREKCVHELFEEQVERNPEAVAVVYEDQQLTYGELNRRANQLAHYLRELGVKPDGRVAICVERGFEMMVALLGVLKAGGAYVPLDPAYPVERLRFMLEDSAPVVLLTQRHLKELFTGLKAIVPVLDLADEAAPWRERSETDLDRVSVGLTPEHLAYVIYTSGSTGTPKGIEVPQHSVTRLVLNTNYVQLCSHDVVAQVSNVSFDAATFEIWGALLSGGRLVVIDREEILSPVRLASKIKQNGISVLFLTTGLFNRVVWDAAGAFVGIRYLLFGGEQVEPRWVARVLTEGRPQHLLHVYGPTETTTYASWHEVKLVRDDTVPIGRPIANTQIYILDSQGAPAPVGVVGELYIGGAGVARGYLNRAELTAERFIADPFAEEAGARMYRTGDLGRWLKDGTIEFVGRNDDQVKIRGFRIELGEIEVRLAEHVGVEEAVVVAREEEAGDKRLVAYYTVAKGAGQQGDVVGAEQLRAHLTARLPEYMVPAAYVRMERLPLTANGKLDRKGLPAPEGDAYVVRGYEAPQGETEITLARIWGEVLKIERVGRHDNFFELGGHSLLAVTLVERMRRSDLQVDVRALFTTPTVAELARAVGADAGMVEVPANRIPEGCEAITPEMLPLVDLSGEEIETIVSGVPGGARNVQDIYALAPLQEGILFHHLMGGEGDPYLLATLVEFDSRGRLDSYLEAMQWVIERHDILRTGVVWEGLRQPVQVVWRKAILAVEEVELAGGDVEEQLYERFDPRRHRIDVGQAPLLRAYITYDGQKERWLLMMLLHHLAGDHSTLEVMHGEIQAHLLGRTEQLPAPQPFRNLVAQARLGVSRQEHEAFFRKVLGDVEEPTAPLGLLEVRGDGTGIEQARIRLDSVLAGRLRARARKLGVSAASLCHVAWAQVLARLSGREDVVFGTVLFGRMQGVAGADRGMGLFINTLPVRIRMGEEGVEASVQRTHKLLAELLYHEHASLALAQRCSGVAAPMPLFSSLLNYRHSGGAARARSEEEARAWEGMKWLRGEERTNYPLTLSVDDLGEGFGLTAQTVASIEPKRVCEYMRRALESLITALETAPATRVGSLEVLPESERRQLLYEWNDTRTEYPREKCVHELFEEQVERNPEAVAVVYEDQQLTYGELNRRANQLAHYLRELGVKPDGRVAICVERGFEMMVALLGVLKAGGAYVPLDPAYPVERLRFMLEDSAPVVLLTQRHLKELFTGLKAIVPVLDLADEAAPWRERSETDLDRVSVGLTPEHLAYVIYTSGSTGTPKGVMVEHESVANFIRWGQVSFSSEALERTLSSTSLNFDLAVYECLVPLTTGAAVIVVQDVLDIVRTPQDVTLINTVPSAIKALVEANGVSPIVRMVNLAGEPLKHALVEHIFATTGADIVCNLYGPSETTTYSSWAAMRRGESFAVSIGRPIANTQIYILDSQGAPAPVGVVGELYIGGAGVARGYLNRAELTAERFIADPFAEEAGARMYRTGDLGRWLKDGTIEFVGRNDDQVKIRGFRIELGEIEVRLAEHVGVEEAVVVAREEEAGDKRLVAYYTVAKGAGQQGDVVGAEQLRAHLTARLPEYMVPAAYVRMERLPLTANGKLDRKGLPAPEGDAYVVRGYEAPQGETEITLARIWGEVLKIERVGRHDNFFELGGHSLLAVLAVTRIRKEVCIEITINDLFAHPCVDSLAAHIKFENKQPSVDVDRAMPIRTGAADRPLFLAHCGGGVLHYLSMLTPHIDPNISVYGLPAIAAERTQLRTVEGMAMRMVRMIRDVQPVGPYRLAGWSFGGTLAYEMAKQLIGADQEIEFLGLFDSVYAFDIDPQRQNLPGVPEDLRNDLLLSTGPKKNHDDLSLVVDDLMSRSEALDFDTLVQNLRTKSLLPGVFIPLTSVQIKDFLVRANIMKQANRRYCAQPIPVCLHLFFTKQTACIYPFGRWNALLPEDQIRLIPVEGTHTSMMKLPNVEGLGRALTRSIHDSSNISQPQREKGYLPLVTLQFPRKDKSGAALFCMPGAGANVTCFVELATSLDATCPIYGLQPRGLDGLLVPHSTVAATAESYLRAISEIHPSGPIHLLGHSFGGWVAYEVAQGLFQSGRVLASLTILDSDVPDTVDDLIEEYSAEDVILKWVEALEQMVGRPLGVGIGDLNCRGSVAQREFLHKRLIEVGIMSSRSHPDALCGPLHAFAVSLRARYKPQRTYPEPAHLILADDMAFDQDGTRRSLASVVNGWKQWMPNLFYSTAPGNHMNILTPPHVSALARLIWKGVNSGI